MTRRSGRDEELGIGVELGGRPGRQHRVMAQDRPLEPLQLLAGFEPQVVGKRAPRLLVGTQGLGLAPGSVESEHQLCA